MLKTLRKWFALGGMLVAAAGVATPAQAQSCREPELARLAAYEESSCGRHILIEGRPIQLFVHDFGRDHFTFEIKGFDEYGRLMPDYAFAPVVRMPAGGFGKIESTGGYHFRFHAGRQPVENLPIKIEDRHRPWVSTKIFVSILPPPQPEPVVYYPPQQIVVQPAPIYVPAPQPVIYVQPAPVPVCPTPVYVQPTPRHGHWRHGHDRDRSGFGFTIQTSDHDGGSFFRLFGFGSGERH